MDVKQGVCAADLDACTPDDEGTVVSHSLRLPRYSNAVYFSADRRKNRSSWPADANRELPWISGPDLGTLFADGYVQNRSVGRPNREGMAILLERDSGVTALLAVPGERSVGVFHVAEDGSLSVRAATLGTDTFAGAAPLFAWGHATNAAEAFRLAWDAALRDSRVAAKTSWRWRKHYPEPFEYLGWCSWEQYKRDIDTGVLVGAMERLRRGGSPVRWVLIDDGHQTQEGRSLKSLVPDPEKFHDGWKPVLATRDSERLTWIGLWHCCQGLWETLHRQNDFGDLNEHLAPLPSGAYLPEGTPEAAHAFYEALIGSAGTYGFDFVKIDVQASNLAAYRGTENAVAASTQNSRTLEEAVHNHIPHGMINCMAHNTLCIFNTRYSAVTRCSIDYHLGEGPSSASHIMQSYTNSMWLGWTVWPDHDMFHSSDPVCGRMMAVSKALSAAPIYLSDAPEDIQAEYVLPLCADDGRLFRPLAPAVPLPDSVFLDALNDTSRPYRVIAPLANGCAAVAAYNLVQGDGRDPDGPGESDEAPRHRLDGGGSSKTVTGTVSTGDYRYAGMMLPEPEEWLVPDEGLVLYDRYSGVGSVLHAGEEYPLEMDEFQDDLVLLCPVREGWAVVGRVDKYLSPATVSAVSSSAEAVEIRLIESGPVAVYSGRGEVVCDEYRCEKLPNAFWIVHLPVGEKDFTTVIRRRKG